jgi:hypothetical protein
MTEAMRDDQRRFSVGDVARLPGSRAAEAGKAIRLERCPEPAAQLGATGAGLEAISAAS